MIAVNDVPRTHDRAEMIIASSVFIGGLVLVVASWYHSGIDGYRAILLTIGFVLAVEGAFALIYVAADGAWIRLVPWLRHFACRIVYYLVFGAATGGTIWASTPHPATWGVGLMAAVIGVAALIVWWRRAGYSFVRGQFAGTTALAMFGWGGIGLVFSHHSLQWLSVVTLAVGLYWALIIRIFKDSSTSRKANPAR